jgi:indolepyruvate ferredoxin oxidoreductase
LSVANSDQPDLGYLTSRYSDDSGVALLSGVQALVRLPLLQMRLDAAAGQHTACLISGYEGSPLAGYDIELHRVQRLLDENHVVFQPAVNEELAATAISGSQLAPSRPGANYDGVLGIWYGKAPGLDRATDAIRHGNLQGADSRGGVVLVVGDDPATKSSSLPSSSDLALIDLAVPTLFPGNVQEVIDYGLYAIALSRLSGLWAGLKIVVGVADATASVDLSAKGAGWRIGDYSRGHAADQGYAHVATPLLSNPIRLSLEREQFTTRLDLARAMLRKFPLDVVSGATAKAVIGIAAAGKTYFDVRQALSQLGLDDERLERAGVRLLKVGALFPTNDARLREFAMGLQKIVVVEEKRGPLESALKQVLYGINDAPLIVGKRDAHGDELFPEYGELDVDAVRPGLYRELAALVPLSSPSPTEAERKPVRPAPLTLVARTPYFCSGCPHSRSTPVPDGSLVGAGIGCHALVTRSPRSDLGETIGLTQMGGEGAQWIGMSPFVEDNHLFQNLGDGTLMHSGTLAIRAAVASGANITYKILYNSAVAMTGGQQPAGVLRIPELTRHLKAEGVTQIIVTTANPRSYRKVDLAEGTSVWKQERILEAQSVLQQVAGVTALIHDQECAAELRRKRKRGRASTPRTRVIINERLCEGCGDCGRKSNCLSVIPVSTEFGSKTQIHQESCNLDASCLQGNCPSFVTVKVDDHPGNDTHRTNEVVDLQSGDLPQPVIHVPDDFSARITGIGGTGIVTVAQILAMAAVIVNRHVTGLDQTGMAQKGGPVVSDLTVTTRPTERAAKLSRSECDLYLVADVLTGVEAANLSTTSSQRTTAVVSTSKVVPGELIGEPFKQFPDADDLVSRIASSTNGDRLVTLDALAIANWFFGNDVSANLVLLGAAYQAGAVPLPARALEEAIARNGVAVAANTQAFRRGRQAVAAPDALKVAMDAAHAVRETVVPVSAQVMALVDGVDTGTAPALRALLLVRVPDLVGYQDVAYARRYTTAVAQVRTAEIASGLSSSHLSENVARYLYKLMAYKDEYEVARLSLEGVNDAAMVKALGRPGKASYHLEPPILVWFGLRRKLRLGPWMRPVFRVLYAMRWVRGTILDPFGRHPVRRLERELIFEYMAMMSARAQSLTSESYPNAVALAETPDLIRGYDDVKVANVERFRQRVAELSAGSAAAL